jgi:hypothetical protein
VDADTIIHRLVGDLFDSARHEFDQYLEALIGNWLVENDAEIDEIELVVDMYDHNRIVMYPRFKTETGLSELRYGAGAISPLSPP